MVLSDPDKEQQTIDLSQAMAIISQNEDIGACRISVFNKAFGSIGYTPWISREDALTILRNAKKNGAKVLIFNIDCKRGKAPKILFMLA